MKTFTYSILAFCFAVSLAAPACSSGDSNDDDNGGNGGSGGAKSGGKGGGSSTSGPGAQEPDGDDAAAWKKFLEDGEFRKEGWKPDVAMPRKAKGTSPHGRVRVFFNEKVVSAHGSTPVEYEKGSVVVKEFFDEDDESVGWTALRKIKDGEDEFDAWQVFCAGPRTEGTMIIDRCLKGETITVDEPVVGTLEDHKESCTGCHHKGTNAVTKLINTRAPRI